MQVLYHKSQRTFDGKAMQKNDDIVDLAITRADVSSIEETDFKRFRGADGVWYYDVRFKIKAIFLSASIASSLWHKGKFTRIRLLKAPILTDAGKKIQHRDLRVQVRSERRWSLGDGSSTLSRGPGCLGTEQARETCWPGSSCSLRLPLAGKRQYLGYECNDS